MKKLLLAHKTKRQVLEALDVSIFFALVAQYSSTNIESIYKSMQYLFIFSINISCIVSLLGCKFRSNFAESQTFAVLFFSPLLALEIEFYVIYHILKTLFFDEKENHAFGHYCRC